MKRYPSPKQERRIKPMWVLFTVWLLLLSWLPAPPVQASAPVSPVTVTIQNLAWPKAEGAAWEGNLTGTFSSSQIDYQADMTAKKALEALAEREKTPLTFTASPYGAFLSDIGGVGSQKVPGASWAGWTYTVNGLAPQDAMENHELQPGDRVTFSFQTGWPSIDFSISNQAVTKAQGAPWEGTLAEQPYAGEVFYTLPESKTMTVRQALEQYAKANQINLKFTSSAWGDYLSEVNGLSSTLQVPGGKWPGWLYSINGKTPEEGMDKTLVQPGDKIQVYFTITWESPETTPSTSSQNSQAPSPSVTSTPTSTPSTPQATTANQTQPTDFVLPQLTAEWPSFRGRDTNQALYPYSAQSPIQQDQTQLLWTKGFGNPATWSGFSGQPIIVNHEVLLIHGNTLEALDPQTGKSLRTLTLPGNQGYASTAPLYADGLLFLPLDQGKILALRADNWQTLWTYQDPLKGQSQSPFTYADGSLYAGFWNSGSQANLVALDARTGKLLWHNTEADGYYWAGGLVQGAYFLTGSESGQVQVFERTGGAKVDTLTLSGPIRQGIVADKGTFFTADNKGLVVNFSLDSSGKIHEINRLALGRPVTANLGLADGKVYIASNEVISVLDQASFRQLQQIPIPGYAQGSPLFLKDQDTLHVYFTVNQMPGALYHFQDRASSQQTPQAQFLYVPPKAQEGYSLSSPILGPEGQIIYRNDSGQVFALVKAPTSPISTTQTTADQGTLISSTSPISMSTPSSDRVTANPSASPVQTNGGVTSPAQPAKTGQGNTGWLIGLALLILALILVIVIVILKRRDAAENQNPGQEDEDLWRETKKDTQSAQENQKSSEPKKPSQAEDSPESKDPS